MKTIHPSLYRGTILHFLSDPAIDGPAAYEFIEDGVLVVDQGKVVAIGEAEPMIRALDHPANLTDLTGYLLMPGFIDPHIHFPQTEIIASYGRQLLDWLQRYTFPAEARFKDPRYALKMAEVFLRELLRNGTTTAAVFGSVHKTSVEAFFEVSDRLNTRMVCGKVLMDRRAPEELCDTPESGYEDSRQLIEQWHNTGRQQYALTPRFAITSSPEQLQQTQALSRDYPDLLLQSHLSETPEEMALVAKLFPDARDYLDVYDRYGLVHERSIYAHGIHLNERELARLKETGASVAFCPSSNLFLGSGLLDTARLDKHGVRFGIATDIGAGTSFSMLHTLNEAYKVSRMQQATLEPLHAFYLATLGNAKLLHLEDRIGSFKQGNEADFLVIDRAATPLMKLKQTHCESLQEQLFTLMMLGDDRAIKQTYIAGQLRHDRDRHMPDHND